jgi:hypothetical protein
MTDNTIQLGVSLAEQALAYAMFNNGQVTGRQVRGAIKIIFGAEVDAAMQLKYGPAHSDQGDPPLPDDVEGLVKDLRWWRDVFEARNEDGIAAIIDTTADALEALARPVEGTWAWALGQACTERSDSSLGRVVARPHGRGITVNDEGLIVYADGPRRTPAAFCVEDINATDWRVEEGEKP